MRARRGDDAAFLDRTEAEWRALGVPERYLDRYRILPALGWSRLARSRALRPDEVARLTLISTGMVPHPRVSMERALQLLANHEGRQRCAVPELCAHGRTGCECHDDPSPQQQPGEH